MGRWHCPDCGRKTVVIQLKGREDNYRCTWRRHKTGGCSWYFFADEVDAVDRAQAERFAAVNPGWR